MLTTKCYFFANEHYANLFRHHLAKALSMLSRSGYCFKKEFDRLCQYRESTIILNKSYWVFLVDLAAA